jgi:hypothetical protein
MENLMKREEITVTTKDRPETKFNYNFSENTTEAIQMFEENNVHELFVRALTIAAQANARKMLSAGYTPERIQIEMDQWKPGVTVSMRSTIKTVDPVKVITEQFDDWTDERQEEIFRLIQERFAARGKQVPAAAASNGEPEPTPEEIAAITAGVNGDTESEETQPNYDPAAARRRNR